MAEPENKAYKAEKSLTVLVVHNVFPKYRYAVFNRLLNSKNTHYALAAGDRFSEDSLALAHKDYFNEELEKKYFVLRNYWFGRRILWQSGAFKKQLLNGYDVVVFTGSVYQLSTWVGALLGRLKGQRVLFWTHGVRRPEGAVKAWLRTVFYRLANGFLLYSYQSKTYMETLGFDTEQLYVLYNSLDYETQKKYRDRVSDKMVVEQKQHAFEQPELPTLICIGRLSKDKQLNILIEALALLADKGNPVNLFLIGDGPCMAEVLMLIKQHRVGAYVSVQGACYDEAVLSKLMCSADLAVLPGYIGLSAMHFFAYGLPVLTSNDFERQKPEVEAIVAGETGGFFKHGDKVSLAQEIEKWLPLLDESRRQSCIDVIESFYNAEVQAAVIDYACRGHPASQQPYLKTAKAIQ